MRRISNQYASRRYGGMKKGQLKLYLIVCGEVVELRYSGRREFISGRQQRPGVEKQERGDQRYAISSIGNDNVVEGRASFSPLTHSLSIHPRAAPRHCR